MWCLRTLLTLPVRPRATALPGTGGPAPAPDFGDPGDPHESSRSELLGSAGRRTACHGLGVPRPGGASERRACLRLRRTGLHLSSWPFERAHRVRKNGRSVPAIPSCRVALADPEGVNNLLGSHS